LTTDATSARLLVRWPLRWACGENPAVS